MEKIIYFIFEKETKGAVRFSEIVPEGIENKIENKVVQTLYIRKTALGEERPKKIEVQIKTIE